MFFRLVFEDGTVVGDGGRVEDNVRKCAVTQCVNGGKELSPGTVGCAALDAVVQMERQARAGERVTVYRVKPGAEPVRMGVFLLEKPTRERGRLYRLVGYDPVRLLDRDLSQWLAALDGWPYTLKEFAGMVCGACGVELVAGEIPNGGFPVQKFFQAGATGRQILQWVGEMACRFLYADPEGRLRFGWYEDRGGLIMPTGDHYFFAGALKYEDFQVAAIDAVKVRLAGAEGGLLWPEGEAEDPYVVSGNPITLAKVDSSLPSYLEVIRRELAALPSYRPCKVSVPADRDIRVGDIVTVEDLYGARFRTLVMTRTVTGQRQTLECTGSRVRGDAVDRRTPEQIAQDTVDRQTQKDIFNKLTGGGEAQGLFLGEDGNVYINASWIAAGVLASKDGGKSFYLDLDEGVLKMQATELTIRGKSVEQIAGDAASGATDGLTQQEIFDKLTGGGSDQGIYLNGTDLYLNASCMKTGSLDAGTVEVRNLNASKISGGTLDASKVTVSNLSAGAITTGKLKSSDGMTHFDLGTGQIVCQGDGRKVMISGGDVRLYNGDGDLVAVVTASSGNGCLKLYDNTGTERLGITATAQGPMVTLWDEGLGASVSRPVCFRNVGGVMVVAGKG